MNSRNDGLAEHPERVIEFFDQYLADKSEKEPNNATNSESQKPCSFVKLLWAAGYGERYLEYKKKRPSFKTTNN